MGRQAVQELAIDLLGRRNAKLVAAALKAAGTAREALRAALRAQPAFQSFGAVASEAELDAAWNAEPFSLVVDDVEEGPPEGTVNRELVHYTPDNSLADFYWPLFDRALATNPEIYPSSGQWVAVNLTQIPTAYCRRCRR